MTPVRFGVHVLIVLTLMVAVSWPDMGQVRAVSAWRADGPLSGRRDAASTHAGRGTGRPGRQTGEYGFGSAAYAPSTGANATGLRQRLSEDTVEGRRRRPIHAGVLALGGKLNAILGRARTALNSPMPGALLVLRNLTSGQVEARTTASETGEFVFLDVTPDNYVVELLGAAGEVNATSESLAVDLGELVQTTVRAPSVGALKAIFGSVMEATASDAVLAASRDGVTQVATPERCVSPPCNR
jgi:hypothetical protein